MKRISLLSLLGMILLSGCEKFLDREPESIAGTSSSFYSTAAQAESGLTGVYDAMQADRFYLDMLVFGDVTSDINFSGSDNKDNIAIDKFTVNPTNGIISRNWQQMYTGIARANDVIDHVSNMGDGLFTAGRKSQILGEARLLRALYYFSLVRVYANVPLVLKQTVSPDNSVVNVPNNTPEEVYANGIIPDLLFAAETLGKDMPTGRAAKGTAYGLLSKVYLTLGDWANAADYAKKVIDLNKYELVGNYDDLWELENTKESLLEVQFTGSSEAQVLAILFLPDGAQWPAFNIPTPFVVNLYDAGDSRKASSVIGGSRAGETNFVYKYRQAPPINFAAPQNIIWLRYADVKLMRAEALNEMAYPNDEALNLLNDIRIRAGASGAGTFKTYSFADLTNQQQFRDAVAKERILELASEGQRWFDLVRTGKALQVMKPLYPYIDEHNLIFPIPQSERDKNPNLDQNLGYF